MLFRMIGFVAGAAFAYGTVIHLPVVSESPWLAANGAVSKISSYADSLYRFVDQRIDQHTQQSPDQVIVGFQSEALQQSDIPAADILANDVEKVMDAVVAPSSIVETNETAKVALVTETISAPAQQLDSSRDSLVAPMPETVSEAVPDKIIWSSVWRTFHTSAAAEGFSRHLAEMTGLTLRVTASRTSGVYQVEVAHSNDVERLAATRRIYQATGYQPDPSVALTGQGE